MCDTPIAYVYIRAIQGYLTNGYRYGILYMDEYYAKGFRYESGTAPIYLRYL